MSERGGGPGRLPVIGGLWGELMRGGAPPSPEEARRMLGGAWVGGPDVGAIVRVRGAPGPDRTGVVVHAGPSERDVWIGPGRIARVPASRVEPRDDDAGELAAVSADARVHASLNPGQRVVYQRPDGEVGEGVLVEKLRLGSLVGAEDGRLLAVSFRRVGPAPRPGDAFE